MGRTVKRSKTSSFGTVTREGHDSRAFYGKRLYEDLRNGSKESGEYREHTPEQVDVIHCADSPGHAPPARQLRPPDDHLAAV